MDSDSLNPIHVQTIARLSSELAASQRRVEELSSAHAKRLIEIGEMGLRVEELEKALRDANILVEHWIMVAKSTEQQRAALAVSTKP